MDTRFIALPDQRIRQKSAPVTNFDANLARIVKDLVNISIVQTNPLALGMAAPQIGVFKQVFVAKIRNKFKAFVNPRITKFSRKVTPLLEGCFSVAGIYGHVTRPAEIEIEAQDMHGKKISTHFIGLPAKIIQHELDHLEGILFIDHVFKQNSKIFRVEKDNEGKDQLIEIDKLPFAVNESNVTNH